MEPVVRPLLADPACEELLVVLDSPADAHRRRASLLARLDPRVRVVNKPSSDRGGGEEVRLYAASIAHSEVMVYIASIQIMLKRLRPNPQLPRPYRRSSIACTA